MMREVMVVFLHILSVSQLILIKVSQAKYLKARTVWRSFHHITKAMVLESGGTGKEREVNTLHGENRY